MNKMGERLTHTIEDLQDITRDAVNFVSDGLRRRTGVDIWRSETRREQRRTRRWLKERREREKRAAQIREK